MRGLFITFEGTEGSGKSTQIVLLTRRLIGLGHKVHALREPGGTPIGEEIRHTLKHSDVNHGMMSETELLLMNASRAQLVREIIRPALNSGEIVVCDRFYDSTTAYQGYGRGLNLEMVRQTIACAVGETRPDLTILLTVPVKVSEARGRARLLPGLEEVRDRMEEADRSFFERVEAGYKKLSATEPDRIKPIDATLPIDRVSEVIWTLVQPLLPPLQRHDKPASTAPLFTPLLEKGGETRIESKYTRDVMSTQFADIRITGLNTDSTRQSPTAPGLRLMYLSLSDSPPQVWGQIFKAERQFPRHTMWRRAWIEDNCIVVDCVPEELEKFHLKDLKTDVANSNIKFREFLAMAERQAQAGEEATQRERERIEKVKRQLNFD
jgi:dTMP kinase